MVVSNSARTRVRLIDHEDACRIFRHLAPVDGVTYVAVCEVNLSLDDAWRQLRDADYGHLQSDGKTLYVVTDCSPGLAAMTGLNIAKGVFGVEVPHVTIVHPTSSQAGLASFAR